MKKGITLSVFTAIISGCSIYANSLFVSKTDPLVFAIVRNSVVAIFLTILLFTLGHIHYLKKLTRHEWTQLVFIGIIGGGIPFALFFMGLAQVGAINGNIIQKTLFLWVAILAVPILHERISKIQMIGYISLFLGMFVFGGTFTVLNKTGSWLILGATILWAVENVLAKVALKTIPSTIVSWGRMVFGLPCLLLAFVLLGKSVASSYAFTPILISSILLTLYVTTWYAALSKAPATLVSSILVFAPVVTAILTGSVSLHIPNMMLLTIGTFLMIFPKKQLQEEV